MDDIFSLLIYLIVIISFLSSLFKKKTPQAPPQQQSRVPQDRLPEEVPAAKQPGAVNEDYDLMREIENMFKSEEEKMRELEQQQKRTKIERGERTIERKPASEHISYEQYASSSESEMYKRKSENFRDRQEQEFTISEHQYAEPRKRKTVIDKKTEQKAREFQALLERRSKVQNPLVSDLIRKIKNPATFREYMLVSEILARPKALRR